LSTTSAVNVTAMNTAAMAPKVGLKENARIIMGIGKAMGMNGTGSGSQ
jgi:hypothetical protein